MEFASDIAVMPIFAQNKKRLIVRRFKSSYSIIILSRMTQICGKGAAHL